MADDTGREDLPAATGADGSELSDDDLGKVSGGTAPMIKPPVVRINLANGPGLSLPGDVQHGDPHVSE